MAHLPRRPLPSYSPQVIQRSKHREVGVYAKADDKADLAFLKDMAFKHPVAVHAFVLMTNPVHSRLTPDT